MLVNIKAPHINGTIEGIMSPQFIKQLKKEFGDLVSVEETPPPKREHDLGAPERLLRYRKMRGFTQRELGDKIKVSRQYICDLEKGERPFSLKTAMKLAKVFKTKYDSFYTEGL